MEVVIVDSIGDRIGDSTSIVDSIIDIQYLVRNTITHRSKPIGANANY